MPIYQYECSKCKAITTLKRSMADSGNGVTCSTCDQFSEAHIIITSAPIVKFKGGPPTQTGVLGKRHSWQG